MSAPCGHFLAPNCGCVTLTDVINAAAERFDARPIEHASIEAQRELAGQRPFRVIVADPPWRFSDKLPGDTRGAEKQYDVMTIADICALAGGSNFPVIAKDAHLFLWRVSSMPQEALDVIKAWGFVVKSELVWVKKTKNGKPHFGMGRHTRLGHEVCHIATRGKGAGIKSRSVRSVFYTDFDPQLGNYEQTDDEGGGTFDAVVREHSRKPDEFYRIVEELCEAPERVELFAREARPGWIVLGNDLPDSPTTLVTGGYANAI